MLNVLELLFLQMGLTTVLLGSLVNFLEPCLPTFISKIFRYGKFASDKECNYMPRSLEIRKSNFKHFYAFALVWGAGGLYLGICAYLSGKVIPGLVQSFLDLFAGSQRTVEGKN